MVSYTESTWDDNKFSEYDWHLWKSHILGSSNASYVFVHIHDGYMKFSVNFQCNLNIPHTHPTQVTPI